MKPPKIGARNCEWSYESLVCQRTNFIELKVSATSHEAADRTRAGIDHARGCAFTIPFAQQPPTSNDSSDGERQTEGYAHHEAERLHQSHYDDEGQNIGDENVGLTKPSTPAH
jgi:hypothetical protein